MLKEQVNLLKKLNDYDVDCVLYVDTHELYNLLKFKQLKYQTMKSNLKKLSHYRVNLYYNGLTFSTIMLLLLVRNTLAINYFTDFSDMYDWSNADDY